MYIGNAAYFELGASGYGLAWTHADHLELDGYAGDAIGAEGDLVANHSAHHGLARVPPNLVDSKPLLD